MVTGPASPLTLPSETRRACSIPDAWRRSGGEALKVALKQGAKSKAPAYVWKNAQGTHRLSFQDAHARADALAATIRATAVAAKKVASVAEDKAVNVGLVLKRSASLPLAQVRARAPRVAARSSAPRRVAPSSWPKLFFGP